MRVQETTLDLGKLAHGAGFSDLISGSPRIPFSPTGSRDWPLTPTLVSPVFGGTPVPNTASPWDDPSPSALGQLFQPFTMVSESNVNLVNVRIAKLAGVNGATVSPYSRALLASPTSGQAVSLRLNSDQVNNLSISPLIAAAFGGAGVGNLGLVSSLDHISLNANPSVVNLAFLEHPVWPLGNPYVTGQDVAAVNGVNGSLIATNSLNLGVTGWADGLQPQPTVSKPRIGDATGHTLTIPDKPHDAPDLNVYVLDPSGTTTIGGLPYRVQSYFGLPKVGLAIPIGTPVGTYANTVGVFEDSTPPQWKEWLASSSNVFAPGVSNDSILNVSSSGSANEIVANPTFALKVTVRESRLTGGFSAGVLPQIDSIGSLATSSSGANTMPAVWMSPGSLGGSVDPRQLFLYWATNRTASGVAPTSTQPWSLAISKLTAPYTNSGVYPPFFGDFNFANGGSNAVVSWWTNPLQFVGYGPAGTGSPASLQNLFPSTQNPDQLGAQVGQYIPPFLAGVPNPATVRLSTPAVAPAINYLGGYGSIDATDKEAYLFWQGQVDKVTTSTNTNAGSVTDVRTFFQAVGATSSASAGLPTGPTFSLMNDPTLVKLSPKPLLLKLPANGGAAAQKFLYLFWHTGSGSNAKIYYNVAATTNVGANFDPSAGNIWSADTQLPLPGSLVSQSNPYPTYRRVWVNGGYQDAIDLAFTGVLKNRQKVEVLLARYLVNRSNTNGTLGSLTLAPLPTVNFEVMSRVGGSNTYVSRDAFWALGTGVNGSVGTNATDGLIQIDMVQSGTNQYSHLNYKFKLDPVTKLPVAGVNNGLPQLGNIDPASGLVTYNVLSQDLSGNVTSGISGGQLVVDPSSGSVTFPQLAPAAADTVLASYVPYLMRLSTSRDETNVVRSLLPAAWQADAAFVPHPAANSPGSNSIPVVVFDRGPNPRAYLTAPSVVFNSGGSVPELDRMWVLYRKSDPSGAVKSTIYYKAMRLMVKLPRPFQLGTANAQGQQQLAAAPVVTGARGPYEVDWVRGRIYFTELDEGNQISVAYQYYDSATNTSGNSGAITYTVAWGDEMSSTSIGGDQTVPENPLPTDQAVNEGQVAAFKDPYLDKLWVFWTSTRSDTTDLYYETIAPQLYITASNQQ